MRRGILLGLNRWLAMGLLVGLSVSCDSSRQLPITTDAFIFPDSRFTGEGVECLLSQALRQPVIVSGGTTNWVNIGPDELRRFLADAGESQDQIAAELADPFVVGSVPFTEFAAQTSGKRIAEYYAGLFLRSGWKEVRGIYAIETTLCGGDWLRVYQKGGSQVLLHVCGLWDEEARKDTKWVAVRTIKLKFMGITPSELLGANYQKAGSSAQENAKGN